MTDAKLTHLKLGREVHESDHLDAVPRALSRQNLPADLTLFGEDLWNAYEASFLLPNQRPQLLHLQVRYPASTPNIVESKSFKLFLNHFNFMVFESTAAFLETVSLAVSQCVQGPVHITPFTVDQSPQPRPLPGYSIDTELPAPYPDTPDAALLKPVNDPNPWCYHSHLLRSRCPVTGQPDWGAVIVSGQGQQAPTAQSLLTYVLSYRSHQGFHEACCESIFADLMHVLQPQSLSVRCLYTRRGGLDINPYRTTDTTFPSYPHLAWRQ